jgi:GT2 family glycosyltransferase
LGGFNERYAGGGDADEFFWRLQLAGYSLGFAEDALIAYRLRSTVWGTVKQSYSYASGKPQLYREFRKDGLPRSFVRMLLAWGRLVICVPCLVMSKRLRSKWMNMAAVRLGHLKGSIRERVVYL